MNNRIIDLFNHKKEDILSVFFTAGFPRLNDTSNIIHALEGAGADLIEIGMPYSDPVADGETIQASNKIALDNGMSVKLLFEQLTNIRQTCNIPLLLMGYLNPVVQYGVEAFCAKAKKIGIDGVILPDLPIDMYVEEYKHIFEAHELSNILLVTPQTSDARIRLIDEHTNGFIYLVADNSITGKSKSISEEQIAYFQRIKNMNLKNPIIAGFGISDSEAYQTVCRQANGAIIGSAFIRTLETTTPLDLQEKIKSFIYSIKN